MSKTTIQKIENSASHHINHYLMTGIDGNTQIAWEGEADFEAIKNLLNELELCKYVIARVYEDLPSNKDWLNPQIEAMLKKLAIHQHGDPLPGTETNHK